jgi:hypothetical protein
MGGKEVIFALTNHKIQCSREVYQDHYARLTENIWTRHDENEMSII